MTRFSDAFGFTFANEQGKKIPVMMGCYGLGPSRVMGTIVEIFNDEKGIIWPEAVAPYKVHVVVLGAESEVMNEAEKLLKSLEEKHIEVLFDDRAKATTGEKLGDADLIGIPYRVVVSKKTLAQNGVELKLRNESDAQIISQEELLRKL